MRHVALQLLARRSDNGQNGDLWRAYESRYPSFPA